MIPYLHSEFCPYLRKTASQQICSIISEKFYYVCLEQCVLGSAHQTPHRFISPESALKFMPHKSRRVSLNTFFPEANCPTKKQMSRIIPSVGHYFLTLGSCVSISSPVKACAAQASARHAFLFVSPGCFCSLTLGEVSPQEREE